MKSKFSLLSFSLLLITFISSVNWVYAQSNAGSATNQDLYKEIAHMDSVLFNAFNNRDIEKTKTIFSTDVEFFHDKGGLTDYTKTIENTRQLFEKNNGLKRKLVAGSMEVYPIPGYGAIQTGMHRFCHIENGKNDCGTFKFVHIWQKKDNVWKLTRVISYDHK